ncbi:fasciclin domain-containing protein [Aureibacter tunicatorum]|uniref:Surface protein with fasciclin (FAS1) repeats n=1 Tax=Aureibacter tunicatorum TaxID=866807 RepID=A0AAE3XL44_9BACT|nr:fasciclin domain-containing protein [Aureibacter tunicatorum]MDR6237930.1 putative surface protein with fasciclin (FAS1) repeats [Aureibacter tunicatorum]BDD02963.1 hypothetical protein AUTU_04460 [Aureibacter tunicatorum]
MNFIKRKASLFYSVALAALVLSSCKDDDNDMQLPDNPDTPKSISETASSTDNLSQLTEALKAAGLYETLNGDGSFTVFAPIDDAFKALLDSNDDWNNLGDIPTEILENVLLYHVLNTQVNSESLFNGYTNTLASGPNNNSLSLQIDIMNGVKFNGNASPITVDVTADNGIVHLIDKVMLPKNIVGIALANSEFSLLVEALTDERHTTNFVELLSSDNLFTVFAPTNAAFEALLASNDDWNSISDIPIDVLDGVLKYHVIKDANVQSSQLSDGLEVSTVSESVLSFDLSNGAKIITTSDQTVNITVVDIQTTNGVIHAIDQVLLPNMEKPEETPSIFGLASATADLSILKMAVEKAGLSQTLSEEGQYTVLAPTNEAFENLLAANDNWNSLDDIPVEVLTNVLLFHTIGAKVMSTDLSNTYVNTLATGPAEKPLSLRVSVDDMVTFNENAKPINTNIIANNGVVHIIDKVMLPPNIVGTALSNPAFSLLVAALTDERHSTDFVSVLSMDGPYTVFAPTNDAFKALLNSNENWNSLADIPIETLDAVLKYHVIGGANVQSSELTNDQEISFLNGGKATVKLGDGAMLNTSSGQNVDIIITDVQTTNGVIHAVNEVLLP